MFIEQLIKRGSRLSQFFAVSIVVLLCLRFLVQPAQAQPAHPASIAAQLAQVRAATARFHRTEAAKAAGYTFVPGLDSCFNNPGVGGMGFHLIKTSSLDLTVNVLEPEAMVYAPGPNGQLQLDAVEYIVPAAAWDAAGNTQPPSVLGQSFHLDAALGVYILHAWIWRENPLGMFEDWNPKVSCR
ncbi:MAG TPA: hypothetical protein VK249_04580 [Anaerolineales bacterium]|nr:hypothetical protein [Anaerolineales bacterium]